MKGTHFFVRDPLTNSNILERMTNFMNFCVECRHYQANSTKDDKGIQHICTRNHLYMTICLVTGKYRAIGKILDCGEERMTLDEDNACGPDGKFFEPKKS